MINDETYDLLSRWLRYRDRLTIARQLGVEPQTVYNVLNRQGTSERILRAAIKMAVKNKETLEANIQRLRQ